MTKKSRFLKEKIGVTTLVAAPGDTHPSDATVFCIMHEGHMNRRNRQTDRHTGRQTQLPFN